VNPNASTSNPNNIIFIDSTDWGYFPLNENQIKGIDNERAKYFLEGYDHFRLKVLFSIKNPQYKLAPFGAQSTLNYSKREFFEKEKKGMKFLSSQASLRDE